MATHPTHHQRHVAHHASPAEHYRSTVSSSRTTSSANGMGTIAVVGGLAALAAYFLLKPKTASAATSPGATASNTTVLPPVTVAPGARGVGSASAPAAIGTPSTQLQPGTATVVAPDGINLRSSPSSLGGSGNILQLLRAGTTVTVLSASTGAPGWVQVNAQGQTGYVCNDCPQLNSNGVNYVNAALKQ